MSNLDADANIKLREGSFPALLPRLGCGHRNYQSGSIIDFSRWSAPGAYLCLFVRGALWFPQSLLPRSSWICIWWRDDEVFDVFEGLLVVVDVVAMTCAGTLVHCRGHQPRAILTLGPHFSPPCPSRHFIHYFIFSHMDHNLQDIFILCICAFNSRIKVSCADNLCAEVRWFAGDSWRVRSALHCTALHCCTALFWSVLNMCWVVVTVQHCTMGIHNHTPLKWSSRYLK